MKTRIRTKTLPEGFSLFEMLMFVAILAIISSMGLAWFGGNGEELKQARDQRNAQSICSLCQAVEAAGENLVTESITVPQIAKKLAEGVVIKRGVLKGRRFQLPPLQKEEIKGASEYLIIREGTLYYESQRRSDNSQQEI